MKIAFCGGCLLNENVDRVSFFWAYAQARCPDPILVGKKWQQQWPDRLDNMPLLLIKLTLLLNEYRAFL